MADYTYDTGWAWVVLFASAFQIFSLNAWIANYGQFFVEIQSMTGCTAAEAAWIATANYITLCFFSPITDWLCRKFTHRVVIMTGNVIMTSARVIAAMFVTSLPLFTLTIGFLDGLGAAGVFGSSISVLHLYFEKKLGLATGLILSGCSLAILGTVPLAAHLLHNLGFHSTVLICAGLSAQGIVAGALCFPRTIPKSDRDADMDTAIVENRAKTLKSSCKLPNAVEVIQILTYMLGCVTMICGPKYIAPHCKDLGFSLDSTAWMISLAGVPDILAKVTTGHICDTAFIKKYVRSFRLYALSLLILTITCFVLPFLTSYIAVFIDFMFMFFGVGTFNVLCVISTGDLVGSRKYGRTFAQMLLAASIFLFMDILVVARLRDVSGSYVASYYFLGTMTLAAAILVMFQQLAVRWRDRNPVLHEESTMITT